MKVIPNITLENASDGKGMVFASGTRRDGLDDECLGRRKENVGRLP